MLALLSRYRDFRLLFVAQLISNGGDWFATVAALGLVADATNKAGWAAALVFLSQSLPGFFGSFIGGPIADRYNRRTVMIGCCALQTAAAGLFVFAGTTGPWWLVYIAQGSIAFVASAFGPASNAAVPNLVEPDDLKPAVTMVGATWGVMVAVGSLVGAAFTAAFGRTASFVADAASFALAGALIVLISTPLNVSSTAVAKARMRPLDDVSEAIRYARRDPPTMALLGSKFSFGFTSGVVSMITVLANKRFDAGTLGVGILLCFRGMGALTGPFLFQRLAGDGLGRLIRACGIAMLIYGVCYLGVSVSPFLWVAAPLVLLAHLGGGAQWTMSTYGLQSRTPDALRGRVMAGDFGLVTLSMSTSILLSGVLEGVIGVRATIAALASTALVSGSAYLFFTSRIDVDAPAPDLISVGPS